VTLNFDNGVTKELKWSSIVWNAAPSGPPTGPGTIAEASVTNAQPVASTSNPALPVPTQPRPQARPTPPRGAIAQHLPHPNSGSGVFPQHPSKVPLGYRAPTGHLYYGQPYSQSHPPPGAAHPSHPYPTPSSSSNSTPSYNHAVNFMHYQPQLKPDPNVKVNAYYRPRPALDAEAKMQMVHYPQYPPALYGPHQPYPQHLPPSGAPLSPVSPTRGLSTQLSDGASARMKPTVSKNKSPVATQLPTPQQNGDTPP